MNKNVRRVVFTFNFHRRLPVTHIRTHTHTPIILTHKHTSDRWNNILLRRIIIIIKQNGYGDNDGYIITTIHYYYSRPSHGSRMYIPIIVIVRCPRVPIIN